MFASVGWSVILYTKELGVQFLVRTLIWVAGSILSWNTWGRQLINVSFYQDISLSFSKSVELYPQGRIKKSYSCSDFSHLNRCVVFCNSLMTYNVEHFSYANLQPVFLSLLIRCLFRSVAHFLNWVGFLLLSFKNFLFGYQSFIWSAFYKDFSPILWLLFNL